MLIDALNGRFDQFRLLFFVQVGNKVHEHQPGDVIAGHDILQKEKADHPAQKTGRTFQQKLRLLLFNALYTEKGSAGVNVIKPLIIVRILHPVGELAVDGQLDVGRVGGIKMPDSGNLLAGLLDEVKAGTIFKMMDEFMPEVGLRQFFLGDVKRRGPE